MDALQRDILPTCPVLCLALSLCEHVEREFPLRTQRSVETRLLLGLCLLSHHADRLHVAVLVA